MTTKFALEEIQNAMKCGAMRLCPHGSDSSSLRNVSTGDIRSACMNATSAEAQPNGRFKVRGPDLDGDELEVVVDVETMVVVTVY